MDNQQLIESLNYYTYKLCEEDKKKNSIAKGVATVGGTAALGAGLGAAATKAKIDNRVKHLQRVADSQKNKRHYSGALDIEWHKHNKAMDKSLDDISKTANQVMTNLMKRGADRDGTLDNALLNNRVENQRQRYEKAKELRQARKDLKFKGHTIKYPKGANKAILKAAVKGGAIGAGVGAAALGAKKVYDHFKNKGK